MNPYTPPGAVAGPYPPEQSYGAVGMTGVMGVTNLAIELLRQTRPWAMIISILCFIGSAFALLAAGGMFLIGATMPTTPNTPFPMSILGLIYLPFAGLYIYPGLKLWSYGSAIARLVASRSTADLENALSQQKSFWKFSGISALVVIVLYIVGIVAMVGIAAVTAAAKH